MSEMDSTPRPGSRTGRRVTACQRCRRRKQKCDLKLPNCSNCESAHVRCLTYHSGKEAELPRNYISNLEARIDRLNQENQELRARTQSFSLGSPLATPGESPSVQIRELSSTPTEGPTEHGDNSHLQDLVKSVRNVVVEPSRQPRFLGPSSGITLATMVMASIRSDYLPSSPLFSHQRPSKNSATTSGSTPAAESSLPPRHAAEHLVEVYFQYRTPHLPIVDRSHVAKALESAYSAMNSHPSSVRVVAKDMFTTYMVFAISLSTVSNPSGGTNRVMQSEGCFRSAVSWIEQVIAYSRSDLDSLRAVLLLAQFVSMCPWQGSLWHLAGIAMRLCVDIGLHWENEGQSLSMTPEILYERRRLWYTAYHFDRVMSITLGRPFGIADESTQVPLPNPWAASRQVFGQEEHDFDIHHQRAFNHLFSMAKIESEIKHVQQSRTWPSRLAYPRPNFATWVLDIQPRLQEWNSTIPDPGKAHPSSIFANQAYWNVMYNNSILLLYRPNSSMQHPNKDALEICHEAACKLIASIKILQREGKLDVLWRSVHQLFMAGLTIIYGIWQSKAIRDRYPVSASISTLQSCASTLSAMSETFHGAVGCRDVIDTLSSATIDWLINNDAAEASQTTNAFERQVEGLLQQLHPAREGVNENSVMEMSDMLSTDMFAFGEMLNSAAQWPEVPDMESLDFGIDAFLSGSRVDLEPYPNV